MKYDLVSRRRLMCESQCVNTVCGWLSPTGLVLHSLVCFGPNLKAYISDHTYLITNFRVSPVDR